MSAYYQGCHIRFDVEGALEEVRLDSVDEYAANGFEDVIEEARAAGMSDAELTRLIEERVAASIRDDGRLADKLFENQYAPDPDRYRL